MLRIGLRPSWLLAAILTLAHGAAIALMILVSLPLWAESVATIVVLIHLALVLRQHALLLAPGATVAIEISSDNHLSIQTRSSEWRAYDVLGSTYVMPYLTVLNLRQSGGPTTKRVALLPDSLHTEDFRRLRVWLRWKEDAVQS